MKITREWAAAPWALVGSGLSVPEGDEPLDCCNPVPPIDRAHGSNAEAVTPSVAGSSGIVQTKVGAWGTNTVTFDTTPTNGSTLVAALFGNGSGGQSDDQITTTGWTRLVRGTHDGDEVAIWRKVAGASEPSAVTVVPNTPGLCRLVLYEVGGSVNVSGATTDDSAASPLTGPTLVASASTGVLIAAFSSQVATYVGDPTQTPQGDLVTDSFSRQSPGRYVSWVGHEDTVPGSYTPTLTTTPLYAGRLTASVAVNLSTTVSEAAWNTPAPNTIDGDDTSYQAVSGSDVLRIDLGDPFKIVRSRLLIGSQNAGTVTYTIRGANASDFSDAVTLNSETWTATGSYTANDIEFLWTTTTAYQYYELTGTSETRRVFSWELYEADTSLGEDHTHADLQSQITATNELLENTNPTLPSFVQLITANGSNGLLRPIANFANGSNIWLTLDSGPGGSIPSNTIRIHSTAGGSGSVSAGSNSTRVREDSTAGASTTLWSPFDHAHDGIGTITSSSSNTMQRGTWNIRPGAGIALSLTDTDGDGEFDTTTIVATGAGGGSSDAILGRIGGGGAIIPGLSGSPDIRVAGTNDDEFDTTDTSDPMTGWTTLGTPTTHNINSTVKSNYYLAIAANASRSLVGIYKAIPSQPFTVTAKLTDGTAHGTFHTHGLWIDAGSGGKLEGICMRCQGALGRLDLGTYTMTTPTGTAAIISNTATEYALSIYLRIVVTSDTSVRYYYSMGGLFFTPIGAGRNPSMTIANIALLSMPENGTDGTQTAWDWIRFT